jgi:hypothetical protein
MAFCINVALTSIYVSLYVIAAHLNRLVHQHTRSTASIWLLVRQRSCDCPPLQQSQSSSAFVSIKHSQPNHMNIRKSVIILLLIIYLFYHRRVADSFLQRSAGRVLALCLGYKR